MEELISFLTEYAEMLEKMEQKQVGKLGLLLTKELDKIEESIMVQQALDKELQNMENRRRALLAARGLEGKTLKELAGLCSDAGQRQQLMDLYKRLDGAVGNICYYNDQARRIARNELEKLGSDARLADNPTGIYGRTVAAKGRRFEKKV